MKRLESLDVLRGFDLFCLTVFGPLLHAFNHTGDYSWLRPLMHQFRHVRWEGFVAWDLVMPLFMFMAGVSIPFAFSKYREQSWDKSKIYYRILKRVILLWILGMICQGRLLALDISVLRLFSNTLQSIAVGYLVSALFFLHLKPKNQVIGAVSLMLLYWVIMMFVKVGEYGGGDFTEQHNLCEYIDRIVLGHWRDAAEIAPDGSVIFPEGYTYTWILSSLNFAVTVLSGMFAGEIIRSNRTEKCKLKFLFIGGVAMTAAGWLWHLQMPVIKHIWTSSMVLVTSGYCFLLLALFYYIVDYKQWRKGLNWLKIYGMNSIVAYVLSTEVGVISYKSVTNSVFYGLQQYVSEPWYNFILNAGAIGIVFIILRFMYKYKIFVRV